MSAPDSEQMTKDEVIAWFKNTDNISPALESMTPATEPAARPSPDVPMVLASIRLPIMLVEQFDSLADMQGVRRSDVIR